MEMIVHVKDPENSAVYENVSVVAACRNPASKNRRGEEGTATSASTGVKVYKVVSVIAGIICILLAVLIVSLHLTLISERDERKKVNIGNFEAGLKNLTAERDDLKRTLLVVETSNRNLTGQRDELMQKMNDTVSQLNSVTEERDECKKVNMGVEGRLKTVTEERDTLKRSLLVNNLNNGWRYHEGSFYYISEYKNNWQDSRDFCSHRGGQLVIINNRNEQEFIRSLQKKVWIGLSDTETEGVWKWVDGTRLTQSFWRSGEPNNAGNEDCAETAFYTEEKSWNGRCDTENFWVCERKNKK